MSQDLAEAFDFKIYFYASGCKGVPQSMEGYTLQIALADKLLKIVLE
jgi:hypothetical protein